MDGYTKTKITTYRILGKKIYIQNMAQDVQKSSRNLTHEINPYIFSKYRVIQHIL